MRPARSGPSTSHLGCRRRRTGTRPVRAAASRRPAPAPREGLQALLLVVDRDDDADSNHGMARTGLGIRCWIRRARRPARAGAWGPGPPRRPAPRRPRPAASIRPPQPRDLARAPGPRADIRTPSRTPRPPGNTATDEPGHRRQRHRWPSPPAGAASGTSPRRHAGPPRAWLKPSSTQPTADQAALGQAGRRRGAATHRAQPRETAG